MKRNDLERWLRSLVLGATAAPLVLSACGRSMGSELELEELGIIPSRDAGPPDGGRPDSGVPDSGVPDAGMRKAIWACMPYGYSSSGMTYLFDGGGLADPAYCAQACPNVSNNTLCQPVEADDLLCWNEFCGVGRLTEGVTPRAQAAGVLGGHFANMAAHEAAAALAFDALGDELQVHGVDASLVRRARRAAREERRHTQLVGTLAQAHAGRFAVNAVTPTETRSLEAIARENAEEGCVRETLGALVGLHQSRHAADAQVRSVMAEVSADELGHAAWSHALDASLQSALPLTARRRVRAAREAALSDAVTRLQRETPHQLRQRLGLPDEAQLHAWCKALS